MQERKNHRDKNGEKGIFTHINYFGVIWSQEHKFFHINIYNKDSSQLLYGHIYSKQIWNKF
jgi:hypothetical protein